MKLVFLEWETPIGHIMDDRCVWQPCEGFVNLTQFTESDIELLNINLDSVIEVEVDNNGNVEGFVKSFDEEFGDVYVKE